MTWILMEALKMPERFVGVLSACLVMKATMGSTLVAGRQRVAATLLGCALGLICLLALPQGYGTAVAIMIPVALVSLVAGFKPEWSYGVVGAIALAIGADGNIMEVALDRSASIGLGAAVSIVCALVVFPEKSSTRTERHLRMALDAIGDFLEAAASWISSDEEVDTREARRDFAKHLAGAKDSVEGVNLADDAVLREKIEWVDRLYVSVVFLKRVGERDERGTEGNQEVVTMAKTAREFAKHIAACDGDMDGEFDALEGQLSSLERALRRPDDDGAEVERRTVAFAMKEVTDSMRKLAELYGVPVRS